MTFSHIHMQDTAGSEMMVNGAPMHLASGCTLTTTYNVERTRIVQIDRNSTRLVGIVEVRIRHFPRKNVLDQDRVRHHRSAWRFHLIPVE
eukprot:COSAG06_NODE_563_length_14268_cov_25.500670_1_plen_89_part_10